MKYLQRRRQASIATVNFTPFIDVTFNLLLFLVLGTTFQAAEGLLPSKIPSIIGVRRAASLPVSPIKVHVLQVGEGENDYAVNIENWRQRPGSFSELTLMLEELQTKPGFNQDTPVVIFASNDVRWDFVVRCFNAIRRANSLPRSDRSTGPYRNVSFAATPE